MRTYHPPIQCGEIDEFKKREESVMTDVVLPVHGIDVSSYDCTLKDGTLHPLSWDKAVTNDGLSLAMIKCSERVVDPAFFMEEEASRGKLPRLFWHMVRTGEKNQAEVILSALKGRFGGNDLFAVDWEYTTAFQSLGYQRDFVYNLGKIIGAELDTTPYICSNPNFLTSIVKIGADERFAEFKLWQEEFPFDTTEFVRQVPILTTTYMNRFKKEICAGTLKPYYKVNPWYNVRGHEARWYDMWQWTARCDPNYLACYPLNFKKAAVDYDAIFVDVSH